MKFDSLAVALLVANTSALKHKSKFLGLSDSSLDSIRESATDPSEYTNFLN
jgi:hypothetical protein